MKIHKVLESKVVLYVLFFIVLFNVYMYAMVDEPEYAAIMIIVGFLTSFFHKNMIIILFTSIAATNLIRFARQQIELSKEGFTGDLSQLDDLMNHMTGEDNALEEKLEQVEEKVEEEARDPNDPIDIHYDYDKNAKLNTDPSKRDEEIDKFIKKLNPGAILKKMEVGVSREKADIAKDKINLALKYTNKIAHEEQRKGVEKLLQLQVTMLDKVINLSPLIDEFREVVKLLKVD
jgi:hypothetical protein